MSVEELKKALDRRERTSGRSGAVPRSPKQGLLDASDVEAAHPDKRVRWLNLKNPEKVVVRQAEGYTRLPAEEGGRSLGDEMALFAAPREVHEERVAAQTEENRRRESAHRNEFQRTVEAVARELRDRHGVNVSAEQLMKE